MTCIFKATELSVKLRKSEDFIIRDISYSINKGQTLVILGQSGSGKTTLCNCIFNLLSDAVFHISGSMEFKGSELLTLSKKDRQKIYGKEIAFIPQNPMTAFNPSVKIGKQIFETVKLHSSEKKANKHFKDEILSIFENLGFEDPYRVYNSYPFELSGGMLQRATVAMAFLTGAELIVADEATSALDVENRNELINQLKGACNAGKSLIMITHDFAVASQFCGELLVMKEGKVVEHGEVSDVLSDAKEEYTKELIAASRLS